MSILKEFWFGNLFPQETATSKISEKDKFFSSAVQNESTFKAMLDERQNKKFEEYKKCIDEFTLESEMEAFKKGFKIGAKFMIECLEDE